VNPVPLFVRLAAAAAAILGLASCAPYDPPLRIAIIRWPPFEYMHLAQEQGFFADEGVEVRLIEFVAVNDAQRAFEHDKIDGGTFSLLQVLQSRDQLARKLQIPLVIDFSDGADIVMARPGITDVKGLRGKRVGVTLSPLDIYFLARTLELNGMSMADVTPVYVRTADMSEAMASGKVDAITAYPPNSSEIEAAGIGKPIFDSRAMPGEIIDVLALDKKVIDDRPEDVAALIRAFYRAVEYARQKPDEAMNIMAARERVAPEDFRRDLFQTGITVVSLTDQQKFLGDDSALPDTVKRISRVLSEHKLLSEFEYESDLLNSRPAEMAARP
jgi:NitT/TauT family transport system substrate-binding protein